MLVILIEGPAELCSRRISLRYSHSLKKKCAKSARSAKSPLSYVQTCRFPRSWRPCHKISTGRTLCLCLEPLLAVTNGTICLPTRQVLAAVSFATRIPLSAGLGWPGLSGGVAFPKLSKLLNQEDALSALCLRGEFCSPRAAPSRGAGMLRTGVFRHFDVTLAFVTPESSCLQALMSPRWWRQMHGQSAPMQGQAAPSWQDGPTSESYSYISTVFGRHQEGKRISLVTMAGAFLHYSAKK
jgi:hypothetical protein